jgi:hypothetical protein
MRVISKGLNGDEQVIVAGLMRAIPGRVVTPVTAEEAAAAAREAEAAKAAKAPSPPAQKQ